jgi:hypothetical protein
MKGMEWAGKEVKDKERRGYGIRKVKRKEWTWMERTVARSEKEWDDDSDREGR